MTGRRVRAAGLAAGAAPLLVVLLAGPAAAAGGITSPGNGSTVVRDQVVAIRAQVSGGGVRSELRLTSPVPGSPPQVVASANPDLVGSATLAYDFNTACASYPSSRCTGSVPAPNGVWTVTLTGGATDSRQFSLRIPPAAPTGVVARVTGSATIEVRWQRGAEPDLTGWTLYDDSGHVVQADIGTAACSGSVCATTVSYPKPGTGSHTFLLTAHRSVAPGSSQTLESAKSAPTSAAFPTTGASASPSAPGAAAPASSASPSASLKGMAAARAAQQRAFDLSFTAGPDLLPPAPASPAPPDQPVVAPQSQGTYRPTLGYPTQTRTERVALALPGRISSAVTGMNGERVARGVAAALVLLLAAAHLRRWLGAPDPQG